MLSVGGTKRRKRSLESVGGRMEGNDVLFEDEGRKETA